MYVGVRVGVFVGAGVGVKVGVGVASQFGISVYSHTGTPSFGTLLQEAVSHSFRRLHEIRFL